MRRETESAGGRRAGRGVLRLAAVLAVVAGVAGGLVAALAVLTSTGYGRGLLARLGLDAANAALAGRLDFCDARVWLDGEVDIDGPVVTAPGGRPVASARRLRAHVHLFDLLRRRVTLDAVRIDGAMVSLHERGGRLDLLSAFEPRRPPPRGAGRPPWQVRIVDLTAGVRSFDEETAGMPIVRFSGGTLRGRLVFDGRAVQLEARLHGASLAALAGRPLRGVPVAARATLRSGKLDGSAVVAASSRLAPSPLRIDAQLDLGRAAGSAVIRAHGWAPGRAMAGLPDGRLSFVSHLAFERLWGAGPRWVDGAFELRGSRVEGMPLGPGRGALRLTGDDLEVRQLSLRLPGATLRGKGTLGRSRSHLWLEARITDLQRTANAAARLARIPPPAGLQGAGTVEVDLRGPAAHPVVSGRFTSDRVATGTAVARQLAGWFRIPARPANQARTPPRRPAPAAPRRRERQGSRPHAAPRGAARGAVEPAWPASLTAQVVVGKLSLEGRELGRIQIAGTLRGGRVSLDARAPAIGIPRLTARLRPGPTTVLEALAAGSPVGRWRLARPATLRLASGLAIAGVVLVSGRQRLSIDGTLSPDGLGLVHAKATALDLAVFSRAARALFPASHPPRLCGRLGGEVSWRGRAGRGTGTVTLAVDGVRAFGIGVARARLEAALGARTVSGRLRARLSGGALAGSFRLPWPPLRGSDRIALRLRARRVPLGLLRRLLPPGEELSGTATVDAAAAGTIAAPRVHLLLHAAGVRHGRSARRTVRATIDLTAGRMTADARIVDRSGARLVARGRLDLGSQGIARSARPGEAFTGGLLPRLLAARGRLDVTLDSIPASDLAAAARGRLDGALHLSGSPSRPRGGLRVRWSQASWRGQPLQTLALSGEAGAERTEADLAWQPSTPGVAAEARLAMAAPPEALLRPSRRRAAPLTGSLTLRDLPSGALPIGALPVAGRIDGRVRVSGSLAALRLTGGVTLQRLRWHRRLLGEARVRLHWDGELATAKLEGRQPQGGRIEGRASLGLLAARGPAGLPALDAHRWQAELHVHGLDLGVLSSLGRPVLRVTGRADADLRAGSGHRTEGHATLRGGELVIAGLGDLTAIGARADIQDDDRLFVHDLRICSGPGALSGDLTFERRAPLGAAFAGELRASDFGLWSGDELRALLDGKLQVVGKIERGGGRGEIRLSEARVTLPNRSSRTLGALELDPAISVGRAPPVEGPVWPLSIHLLAPGAVMVTGTDLDVRAAADIEADLARRAVLRGRIDVASGTIALFGRRFAIRHATFDYGRGRPADDPTISALVTQKTRRAELRIAVSGPLRRPRIDLSSDPPLPREELATLVATGSGGAAPTTALSGPAASGGTALAASVAGAFLTGTLQDAIAPYLPLDVVTLDPRHAEIGRHVGPLYLSGVENFGVVDPRQNQSEVHAQYHLTPRLSLDSTFGDAGAGTLDFSWQHSW